MEITLFAFQNVNSKQTRTQEAAANQRYINIGLLGLY